MWHVVTRALAELGPGAFFIGGVAWTALGSAGPYFVLAAALLSIVVRAADVEARALFVPGGVYGSVRETLGPFAARTAAAALLVDRFVLAALAAALVGHYVMTIGGSVLGGSAGTAGGDAGPLIIGAIPIALVWLTHRQGRLPADWRVGRLLGRAVILLGLITIWGVIASIASHAFVARLTPSISGSVSVALSRWPAPLARAALLVLGFSGPLILLLSFSTRLELGLQTPWYLLSLVSVGYVPWIAVALACAWLAVAAQLTALAVGRYAPVLPAQRRPRRPLRLVGGRATQAEGDALEG